MTKEAKYGILMLIALAILVPTVFLAIKAATGVLYIIFNYPELVITFTGGLFLGAFINNKLK